MLFGLLGASLLVIMLAGKGVKTTKQGGGAIRDGKGIIRAGKGAKAIPQRRGQKF